MSIDSISIELLRERFLERPEDVLTAARTALGRANGNASRNTYLWHDEVWTLAEAQRAAGRIADEGAATSLLCGLPVSVKDCFDLAGSSASCGTRFYRELHGVAGEDSWLVRALREAGAVITGKTHLHPLAYGITGENAEFGDCLQPGDATALTGGSSSGAAASVLEGSAVAAIGTDTGGSIRVPAALCGLAGYRATIGLGDWRGGAHLAASFDTMGWLCREVRDLPALATLFGVGAFDGEDVGGGFCLPDDGFFEDCEPGVLEGFRAAVAVLQRTLLITKVDVGWWANSREIFAPIQASEAAVIHAGHYEHFERSIRERLEWGASLGSAEVDALRLRHAEFRARMDALLAEHGFLILPCAPVAKLEAGADHSQTRARLLRYTTPVSLAGMPAVTVPLFKDGRPAGGLQVVAARGEDARLLAFARRLVEAGVSSGRGAKLTW